MAEILGLGLSHYPLLSARDADMSAILVDRLRDPGVPDAAKDPASWPAEMRAEWSDDRGARAAARHRSRMLEGITRVRAALDAFKPDYVIVWGDDQYENFREDLIPAFSVLAYDDITVQPWRQAGDSALVRGKPNIWNEDENTTFHIRGARARGKELASGLLERDFDVAYAYQPLHHPGLAHAFLNTVLYLDHERTGFPYPVVPFQINCYGRQVISYRGYASRFADAGRPPDPPSPSPRRCLALGAAVAEVVMQGDARVALIASSSWSHAFLVDSTWRMRPDLAADRMLYDAMLAGDYSAWHARSLVELEAAGQQEMLNWFCLVGAMERLEQACSWSDIVETNIFNSTKVAAVFAP